MNNSFFIPTAFIYQKENNVDKIATNLIASIIHSILFEGKVILVDSSFVNVSYLRSAFNSPIIKELIRSKFILFATRFENDQYIPFETTAANIREKNAVNITFPNQQSFTDYELLSEIDKLSHKLPYSLSDARTYYTEGMTKSYSENDYSKNIPINIQKLIYELLLQKKEKDGFLESSFFQRETGIGQELKKLTKNNNIWQEHGHFIWSISVSNYFTFIPSKFEASPIYGVDLYDAFNIWRKTITEDQEPIEEYILVNLLSPSNFVHGLLRLKFDDILHLIDSDEYRAYKNSISSLTFTTGGITEVKKTFELYKRRIDLLILERIGSISKKDHEAKIKFVKSRNLKNAGKSLSEHILMTLLDSFTFGVTSHLKKGIELIDNWKKGDLEINDSIKRANEIELIKKQLNPDGPNPIIQSKTTLNNELNDTMLNYYDIF